MTAGISQGGSKLRSPLKRCRDGWEQLQAVVRARGTVGLIGIEIEWRPPQMAVSFCLARIQASRAAALSFLIAGKLKSAPTPPYPRCRRF